MKRRSALWILAIAVPLLLLAVAAAGSLWLAHLETVVDARLSTAPFEVPARLYSRPLGVRRGDAAARLGLAEHLERLGYRKLSGGNPQPGEYTTTGASWRIARRPFPLPEGSDPGGFVEIEIDRRARVARILDAQGRELDLIWLPPLQIGTVYGPGGEDRELIPLSAMPDLVIDAVLAIEDQHFFDHHGLDLPRIAGAFVANLRARRVVQGGSTITQQLVKNVFVGGERTLTRKVREAALAIAVERRRTKREILEAYLNEVFLGQDGKVAIHGMGSGARFYFGKPVADLDVTEAALLAGLLKGPSLYSPHRRPELARERRNQVLRAMAEAGVLGEGERVIAAARPLGLAPSPLPPESAAYFVDWVQRDLRQRFKRAVVEHGGIAVHTTLDPRLQALAERTVDAGIERLEREIPELLRPDAPLQAALVAIAAGSGDVLALVGGRGHRDYPFNRAVDARRQPGSAFKPIVALAALGLHGRLQPDFTLVSVLDDSPEPISPDSGDWVPDNHDGVFRGAVTLRQAIEQSLNVPIARLGADMGPLRIVAMARQLGIRSPLRAVPSLALGTSEVSVLELTSAYTVFAAAGLLNPPTGLRSVVGRDGAVMARIEEDPTRVTSAEEAWLVTTALAGAVDRGTAASLRRRGYHGPVAGKTGTTDHYRDAWFIGYTPEIAVGVWVGFDDGVSLQRSASRAALPIFGDFIEKALGKNGLRDFVLPARIESISVAASPGHVAGLRCEGPAEFFLEGTGPGRDERCRPSILGQRGPDGKPRGHRRLRFGRNADRLRGR